MSVSLRPHGIRRGTQILLFLLLALQLILDRPDRARGAPTARPEVGPEIIAETTDFQQVATRFLEIGSTSSAPNCALRSTKLCPSANRFHRPLSSFPSELAATPRQDRRGEEEQ